MLPGETIDVTMAQKTLDCSDVVDEILCYITSAIFPTLQTLLKNSQLSTLKYEVQKDCRDVEKFQWETVMRLRVIQEVPLTVMKVLKVARLRPLTIQVVKLEEKVIVFTREAEPSPGFTTVCGSFIHGPVKFSEGAGSAHIRP